MLDSPLQMPTLTKLDAVTQGGAALVYLIVALAAWMRAPADARTRLFLAVAAANAVAFGLPVIAWLRGASDPLQVGRWPLAVLFTALAISALLLLHFLQVFPRRRPWIRGAPWQLPVSYLLAPIVIFGLIFYWPEDASRISPWYIAAVLLFGFPLVVTLGLIVPVAAILSLLKSYREVEGYGTPGLKRSLLWMLISQVAGGALAVVFAPVLAVLAPNTLLQDVMTVTIWAFGLLTPPAFAAAVWKHDALSVPAD